MSILQWSLRILRTVYPYGPVREIPWRLVKCGVALTKCLCSVRFLTACRRHRVIPNFIRNCSRASKLFANIDVAHCEEKFHFKVLNKTIQEKFRRLYCLKREWRAWIKETRESLPPNEARWVIGHSRCMSECVTEEVTEHLRKKLNALLEAKDSTVTTRTETHTRRVVIEESITENVPATVKGLMELGPNFVPKTRVTSQVLRRVEVGVERLAFGKRWQAEEAEITALTEGTGRSRNSEMEENEVDQEDRERPVKTLDEDLRLRKIATTEKQGPLMLSQEENKLRRLKENLLKLYRKAKMNRACVGDNGRELTGKERRDIVELRSDSSVVVKPSDKSKGFVVMSTASYVQKAESMLNNTVNYERSMIKLEDLEKKVRAVVLKNAKNKIPSTLCNAMIPHNSRMSQFYGLPKDHKPDLPLRPVVSACGSPASNISLLLERILNQLLKFVPAHLSSTAECVEDLRALGRLPSDCIIASLDVVSLYTNIPIEESIDAAMELLEVHRQEIDMFRLSAQDVRQLLLFVLQSNYFTFGDNVYRQTKGLAMGSPWQWAII